MRYQHALTALLKSLAANFLVVAGYFLIGLLSYLTDSSALLPLSYGLALAAVLFWGFRAMPGILVCSGFSEAWAHNFNNDLAGLYIASAVAITLGALIGARLINRFAGYPNDLLNAKSIGLFLLFGGPVSALIPAVTTAIAAPLQDAAAPVDAPFVAAGLWLGYCMGVSIITPLVLILLPQTQPSRIIWQRRRIGVALPVLVTFALVIAFFFRLNSISQQFRQTQANSRAQTLALAIKGRIEMAAQTVSGLQNGMAIAEKLPDLAILQKTARNTLDPVPEFKTLLWVSPDKPREILTVFERPALETEVRKLILPALRKQLLDGALRLDTKIISPERNYIYLLSALDPLMANRDGILIAIVSLREAITTSLKALNTESLGLAIYSQHPAHPIKNIYEDGKYAPDQKFASLPVSILGQIWQFAFFHGNADPGTDKQWSFDGMLLLGLGFTGLLEITLLLLTGRHYRTEALIDERTQVLMQMKTAAESANQAKNQFLAKISHELRTPLNGISGFTQLLEKKATVLPEDKKLIEIIKQCSDNLLKLINDILDISAIESQQTRIEISQFDISVLLMELVDLFKIKAEGKGIVLINNDHCRHVKLLGDEKRLRQILSNLLDNAFKYTKHGSINITAQYRHLDNRLTVSISDTGCGIAPENLEAIFSPFVQVNAQNYSQEGIGLGLSISKELANLMSGDLTVASELGSGSVFTLTLTLPCLAEASESSVFIVAKKDGDTNPQPRVLAVDDNRINLMFLTGLLDQAGCDIDSANDGLEALALVEGNDYDLALIDINMPIINGLELAKRLKNLNCVFPLIAVSAYADEEQIKQALMAGFDDYITKPIEEKQLLGLLHAYAPKAFGTA
jgi:signal transduction histidine kinase